MDIHLLQNLYTHLFFFTYSFSHFNWGKQNPSVYYFCFEITAVTTMGKNLRKWREVGESRATQGEEHCPLTECRLLSLHIMSQEGGLFYPGLLGGHKRKPPTSQQLWSLYPTLFLSLYRPVTAPSFSLVQDHV